MGPASPRGNPREVPRASAILILLLAVAALPASGQGAAGPPRDSAADTLSVAQAEAVEARLRSAIQVAPATAAFHASLGELLHRQERFEEARAAFAEAVRLEPANPAYRAGLAASHASLGQWSDAEAHYLLALEANPADPLLHEALADALLAQGRAAEATQHLHRAAELDPTDARLAARLERQEISTSDAGRSVPRLLLEILIRFIAYLSIAAITAAGLAILLPVAAAVFLLVVIVPIRLLVQRRG